MIGNRWILLTLFVWASSAHAFIDPPVITPKHPTTETPVEVAIRNGVCDALLNHTVAIVDDTVELRIRKITTQTDPFCNYPILTAVFELPLLPAGQHPFSIYLQDNLPPDSPPVLWFQTTIEIVDANGAAAVPIPALSGQVSLTLLLFGLLALAARHRCRLTGKQL